MGLGAKLAAVAGLALGWTSWQALLTGTLTAFALAAVYGGVLLAARRARRTTCLPLGPFILLGMCAVIASIASLPISLTPLGEQVAVALRQAGRAGLARGRRP